MSRHPHWIALLILGLPAFGVPAAGAAGPVPHAHRVDATVRRLVAVEEPSPPDSTPADSTAISAVEPEVAEAPQSPETEPPAPGSGALGMEITDFVQREPDDGEPATADTRAYVSYDDGNLYVAFVCEDDPTQVRARVVPRDRITDDDRVVVFLDTFDDNQRAYAFEVNPLGIQRDGFLTEGQDDDYEFDALW